jgi:hypothetical protein
MRIKNTLEISIFQVSEVLIDEVKQNKKLELLGEANEMQSDILGNLIEKLIYSSRASFLMIRPSIHQIVY